MNTNQFLSLTCPRCGGTLAETNGIYQCTACQKSWKEQSLLSHTEIFDTIEEVLREQKMETLSGLKRRLYEETNKDFVSNQEVKSLCEKILDIHEEDIYARFYHATCQTNKSLDTFLSKLDIDKYYEDIPDFLDYLIKALPPKWMMPVSNLIERTYKSRNLRQYLTYRDAYEKMADQVENGTFEPRNPRDIFIAYSSRDMQAVKELIYVLEEENKLTCFSAERNLRHGSGSVENYQDAIHTAIANCKAVVFISSQNSRTAACEAYDEIYYIKEHHPNMPRIEYLLEDYKGTASDKLFQEFFQGKEYCISAQDVAVRYLNQYYKKPIPKDPDPITEEEPAQLLVTEVSPDFEIENGILKKYRGSESAVSLPNTVTAIDAFAFSDCETILSFSVPEDHPCFCSIDGNLYSKDQTIFLRYAFGKKHSVFTLPDSVISIESNAFFGCKYLKNIVLSSSVSSIGAWAFHGCENLTSIQVSEENASFCSINGNVYSKNQETLVICSPGKKTTHFSIPDFVTAISNYAFCGCSKLKSIFIPASVSLMEPWLCGGCKSLVAISVSDENPYFCSVDGNVYSKNQETLILYTPGKRDEQLILSDAVATIGEAAFWDCSHLTSVTLSRSVTSLETHAFENCINLKNILLSDSLTSIGSYAFHGCINLSFMTIPDSVIAIHQQAFSHCSALKLIYCECGEEFASRHWHEKWLGDSNPEVVFSYFSAFHIEYNGKLTEYLGSASEVVIPNSVTAIGMEAFKDSKTIVSITLPKTVTVIGKGAFRNCTDLKTVSIPDSVTAIEGDAFRNCSALTELHIPESVNTIGNGAFDGCHALKNMILPEALLSIGDRVFRDCQALTGITLPPYVNKIGAWAFSNCKNLTNINLPDTVSSISDTAFAGCENLISIQVSAENEHFCSIKGALYSQDQKTLYRYVPGKKTSYFSLPPSVTVISDYAFGDCTGLVNITFSEKLTSIGEKAFFGCTNLESVSIPKSVTSIGDWAFSGCTNLTTIHIPTGITAIGNHLLNGCEHLTSIQVSEENPAFCTIDGNLYSKDRMTLYRYASGKKETQFTIPYFVKTIRAWAFSHCSNLTNVTLSNTVTSVGDFAYCNCKNLTEIILPYSLTDLGSWAFDGCENLTNITLPNSLTTIKDSAFSNCGLKTIAFPSSVTTIGSYAFQNCKNLNNITLPNGIKSIRDSAFSGCTSLIDIKLPSSIQDMGTAVFHHCSNLKFIYCETCEKNIPLTWDSDWKGECEAEIIYDYSSVFHIAFDGKLTGYNGTASEVILPNTITGISDYAFRNCNTVTEILIPESVTFIGVHAFDDCKNLVSIVISEKSQYFSSFEGNLYSKNQKILFHYAPGRKDTHFSIPEFVVSIGSSAFEGCKNLTSITIPESVTVINDWAFANCVRLTNLHIPDSVKTIGASAFRFCVNLQTATISNAVNVLGFSVFESCKKLTNITLPASLMLIGDRAFFDCGNLKNIVIPDTIMEIKKTAFSNWNASQTIHFRSGRFAASSRPYHKEWKKNCNAKITYGYKG